MPYIHFTDEQQRPANAVDLVEFLRSKGEPLIRSGSEFRMSSKAGFIFRNELFPTDEGTPQGGVISPILANMALDGMQKILADRFHTNRLGKVDLRFKNAHKVNLVRYADDFIVTAATREIAEEAKILLRDFLQTRGLELSEEKTLMKCRISAVFIWYSEFQQDSSCRGNTMTDTENPQTIVF